MRVGLWIVNVVMLDENALVEGCRRQDRIVQRQLYERFAGRLFVVCKRYVKDPEEAEDVLQDSFVKIFRHIDSFRFECPLEAWLKRIVINTALKHIRKEKPWDNTSDVQEMAPVLPQADESLPTLNYKYLLNLVQELPAGCRTVFNLYAIEGYSHPEIARMLDIAEGTSKSQYARARTMLQQKLLNEQRYGLPPIKNE
ncbi:sigma-70 family RNA polymerase sigma factor [Spirosoma pomorum]